MKDALTAMNLSRAELSMLRPRRLVEIYLHRCGILYVAYFEGETRCDLFSAARRVISSREIRRNKHAWRGENSISDIDIIVFVKSSRDTSFVISTDNTIYRDLLLYYWRTDIFVGQNLLKIHRRTLLFVTSRANVVAFVAMQTYYRLSCTYTHYHINDFS